MYNFVDILQQKQFFSVYIDQVDDNSLWRYCFTFFLFGIVWTVDSPLNVRCIVLVCQYDSWLDLQVE